MEKIKMAIVGAGVWGETHAAIYNDHPMAEVVAVCDKNQEKAENIAEKYGITQVYEDYKKMALESSCDAVAVVTPDFLHADIACTCADMGKHLLIEKPLATTREDIFRIENAVKRNNVRCMVDLHNRWSPPFNTAKQRIESGELGKPYTAYIKLSDVKWVATDMLKWANNSSILWFLGSHSLDTLRWLIGSEVKRVFSVKREGILTKLGVDVPDIYQTTLEFQNGAVAQMENGWITPNGNANINDFKCSVLCTKGQVDINASSHNLINLVTEENVQTPDILVKNNVFNRCKGFSYESIRDFIDRIIDKRPFRVSFEDARNNALTILAIMQAADSGVKIEVDYTNDT